ncbi:SCO family protein [Aeribacillus pallidus]
MNMKISKRTIGLFIIISTMLLTACNSELGNGEPIQDFEFTNQDGKPFGLADLKGKVWIADFIFTNCETVCPPMTFHMSELQKMVKEEGLENVHFVSFSVDPEIDTPEILKEYASKFDADLSNWHFLTGYSQETIEKFAYEQFETYVKKPQNDDQVIHGTRFFLINADGELVKDYSGNADVPFDEIIDDLKKLQ